MTLLIECRWGRSSEVSWGRVGFQQFIPQAGSELLDSFPTSRQPFHSKRCLNESKQIYPKACWLKLTMARSRKRGWKCRIATDCSGCDAPLFAIKQTSYYRSGLMRVCHLWASDTDPAAQQFIALNHKPKRMFADMALRDNSDLPNISV